MANHDEDRFTIDHPQGDELLRRVSALFAMNGNPKSIDHLKWQYLRNPGGGGYTAIAVNAEGKDAAAYSLFKVNVKMGDSVVTGCQSLDTLTGKEFRGKGLFSLLAKDVNKQCDIDGVSFIYGFPNDKSAPGFFNKLEWQSLGYPPFLIYVNNLGYGFKGLKFFFQNYLSSTYSSLMTGFRLSAHDLRAEFGDEFIAQYDVLWKKFATTLKNSIARDAEYLRWRYLERPNSRYSFVSVYRNDVLVAVAIYIGLEKHQGRIGYLMDVIFDPEFPAAGKVAVGKALEKLRENRVDAVLAWAARDAPTYPAYSANCFFQLPRIAQPIKLFFGGRGRLGLPNWGGSEMFVSYADSDTV